MSGQPVKNLSDQNKFRSEYMESLNIRQQLDDMNLQANKEYLKTGVLPAVSQLTDNRTTSEILADTEKLKASIMSDLSPIANPQFSAAIIQGIQNHFLNADGSLLRFLAQRAGDIVKEIQRVYKFGIVGDTNDVDVLVSFIANLYSDRKNVFGSTKNYINSNSNMGVNRSISSQDIDKIIMDLTDIQKRASIGLSKTANLQIALDFQRLFTYLKRLKDILPTNEELQTILRSFNDLQTNMTGADDLNAIYTALDSIPKMSQVTTILNKIELHLKNKNDNSVLTLLNVLIDQFSVIFDPQYAQVIASLIDYKIRYQQGQPYQPPPPPQPPNPPNPPPVNDAFLRDVTMRVNALPLPDVEFLITNEPLLANLVNQTPAQKRIGLIQFLYNEHNLGTYALRDYELLHRRPFQGLGITKKRRGRPRGCGIVKQERIPNFVGFGINEINQKKLNDNILTIRRNTRTSYPDMPSKKVSPYFSNIMKTMLGGGVPNFNDLSNLPEEEKDYLYKVVQRSDMSEKLSVPTPSKDRLQKDSDQFEIMKGQILSGNDSKELVKKFKLLILKLSRNGLLPKGESKDLLEALITLGY